jgi:hypothetical protein
MGKSTVAKLVGRILVLAFVTIASKVKVKP